MKQAFVHIQAVLYRNSKENLERSLHSLANAVAQAQRVGLLSGATLLWGDASPNAIYTEAQIEALSEALRQDFGEGCLSLQYRYFNENTGYGKGHNRLAGEGESDFLLILNPDILVCYDFFTVMLPPFAQKSTGLTEARQTPVEHPKYYNTKTGEAYWSSGACFVIPTAFYRELGGFDEQSFFMYCEDVDLSFRIRKAGKKLLYQPNAPVYHSKSFDRTTGSLEHTQAELRHSVEAQLVLAYKWKQHALLSRLKGICQDGDEFQRAALASFSERLERKELVQVQGSTSVFKERYLQNRFSM